MNRSVIGPGLATAIRRGLVVGGAYLATALATVAVIFALRHFGAVSRLGQILGVQFIASLAAGLEPGTSRALAIRRGAAGLDGASATPILLASAAKALVASLCVAAVWRLADPAASLALLALSPGVCLAGFLATDLRVLLDLRGRHAQAIWLKQGSLALGLLVLAGLVQAGVPLPIALSAAIAVRLMLIALTVASLGVHGSGSGASGARELLADPRWMNLAGASVLAAVGGSADRIFGLRFLSPQAWSSYYLVYEVFSKAWFIPYLLTPILFARAAGGRDGGLGPRLAWGLTLASGLGFLALVLVGVTVAPTLAAHLIGTELPKAALAAFALGIAINSLVQLRVAELQGSGRIGRAFAVIAVTALCSVALFYLALARGYGAPGLLYAWLIKAIIELALAYGPLPRLRGVSAPA